MTTQKAPQNVTGFNVELMNSTLTYCNSFTILNNESARANSHFVIQHSRVARQNEQIFIERQGRTSKRENFTVYIHILDADSGHIKSQH